MKQTLQYLHHRMGTGLLLTAGMSIAFLLVLALLGPWLFGAGADRIDPADSLLPSTADHPLGTDELGRDILDRVLVATQLSLGISLLGTFVGATVGILIGALASVSGKLLGKLLEAGINLALAFPALLLALFAAAVLGAGASSAIIAIALALAPIFARLTHTLSCSVATADYLSAARLLGVGPTGLVFRHIIPNVSGPLIVTGVMAVSGALLVLSGLSFLGLGVQPPLYDWGVLLSQGLNRIYVSPVSSLAPAGAIVLTGAMLSLVGEALAFATGVRARRHRVKPEEADLAPALSSASDRSEKLLDVERLSVAFPHPTGSTIKVIRNVSFAIDPGERLGLIGESGSGKTITALAAARLAPDGALVTAKRRAFRGHSLSAGGDDCQLKRLLGTSMAFVFQDPLGSFNPVMRIGDQLAEVATEHLGMGQQEAVSRAEQRLDEVGLPDPARRLKSYPHQLSGGMLQRSMVGMGLMAEPRLLIADEPTTALDVTVQKRVLQLIDRVCQETGAGLLLISHDLAVVAQSCDRALVMYAGRIVEDLSVEALVAGGAHPYTRSLRASVLEMDADRSGPIAVVEGSSDKASDGTGCDFAWRCPRAQKICFQSAPHLTRRQPDHRIACWNPCPDLSARGDSIRGDAA